MTKLQELQMRNLRKVCITTIRPEVKFVFTAYDDGDGHWKEEGDTVFIREISLVRHPGEDFEPRWKPIIQTEQAEKIILFSWPEEEELERHNF